MSADAQPKRKSRARKARKSAEHLEQAMTNVIEGVGSTVISDDPGGPVTYAGMNVDSPDPRVRQRVAFAVDLLGKWWPIADVRTEVMTEFKVSEPTADRTVAIALMRLRGGLNETTAETREKYKRMFLAAHDRASELGQMSAAVRAGEAAGRVEGVYVERVAVQAAVPVTEEELEAAIGELSELLRVARARRAIDVQGTETVQPDDPTRH